MGTGMVHDSKLLNVVCATFGPGKDDVPDGYLHFELRNRKEDLCMELWRMVNYQQGNREHDYWLTFERTLQTNEKDTEIIRVGIRAFKRSIHGFEIFVNPDPRHPKFKSVWKKSYNIDIAPDENILEPDESKSFGNYNITNSFMFELMGAGEGVDEFAAVFRHMVAGEYIYSKLRLTPDDDSIGQAGNIVVMRCPLEPDSAGNKHDFRFNTIPVKLQGSIFHQNIIAKQNAFKDRYMIKGDIHALYCNYMDAWVFYNVKKENIEKTVPKVFKDIADNGITRATVQNGWFV